jgi:hypothetical protein
MSAMNRFSSAARVTESPECGLKGPQLRMESCSASLRDVIHDTIGQTDSLDSYFTRKSKCLGQAVECSTRAVNVHIGEINACDDVARTFGLVEGPILFRDREVV